MKNRAALAASAIVVLIALGVLGSIAGAQQRGHDASITSGVECNACHTPEGWDVMGSVRGGSGFDHARTGFPLTGQHDGIPCTECHVGQRQTRRDCNSCHADPHQRRLGQSCTRCHSAQSWTATQAIELHRLTRLPLTGMHAIAACTDCHRRPQERSYSATPAECYACHENDYRNPAVHPNHDGSAGGTPLPRDCAACHRANSWTPAFVDPTVLPGASPLTAPRTHDIRFAISFGPHRDAPCNSCHLSLAAPAAVGCTGCHAHSTVRLRQQHPRNPAAATGAGCLSCHPGGRAR
jgi:hypothetical protein